MPDPRKKSLSERDICTKFITPALIAVGWDIQTQIRREHYFTQGRVIVRDKDGQPEPDPELRDTESVPLKEDIHAYFKREVLPHVPDAWIDESKTKIDYEIPLNCHFYRYEPPRPLDVTEKDIKRLEPEILDRLKEVTS